MVSKGTFGYIIGRKKRFMKVNDDADLLWQILVREMYVIMKHFNSDKEVVKEAFEKIKIAKGIPTISNVKKCKIFTDISQPKSESWLNLLRFCQCSFINLLESGYILLKEDDTISNDYKFELDFNTLEVRFYENNLLFQKATLDEIMEFDEMPTKTYNEITCDMNERFKLYFDKVIQVEVELEKLYKLKTEASSQCAANIEDKVDKLIDDMNWELKELHMNRREFYHRLKILDLIHSNY